MINSRRSGVWNNCMTRYRLRRLIHSLMLSLSLLRTKICWRLIESHSLTTVLLWRLSPRTLKDCKSHKNNTISNWTNCPSLNLHKKSSSKPCSPTSSSINVLLNSKINQLTTSIDKSPTCYLYSLNPSSLSNPTTLRCPFKLSALWSTIPSSVVCISFVMKKRWLMWLNSWPKWLSRLGCLKRFARLYVYPKIMRFLGIKIRSSPIRGLLGWQIQVKYKTISH